MKLARFSKELQKTSKELEIHESIKRKKASEEFEKEQKARAYYQAETDRVWNEYCEQQKKNEEKKYLSAADEYAEYLRLKDKFEKE